MRPVNATLAAGQRHEPLTQPIEVSVTVDALEAAGLVQLAIYLEDGARYVLTLEPAAGAYLAGSLAHGVGVTFG